ncbi:MAG: hypothetical protein DMG59_17515 [Acidobacteria bacterium]|nr:MAG: hypothetical protein DMG59_17515 [Acidobacteriota bacterium]
MAELVREGKAASGLLPDLIAQNNVESGAGCAGSPARNWTLLVTGPTRNPKRDQFRIMRALEAMAADLFSGDMKRLVPSAGAGASEISAFFYDLHLDERLVIVTAIKRRTSTTY